jgi:high frequency lysogenization protein
MELMQARIRALAGVFQAAALVDDLAFRGQARAECFETSIASLYALDAGDVAEIFPSAAGLACGREYLGRVLARNPQPGEANRLNYVLAILHLNGVLRSRNDLQEVIHSRLAQLAGQYPDAAARAGEDAVGRIAALYVDTFGTLSYRVQVKGEPAMLQNPLLAARIRASLLAGVRAAHLWHHLGGRRWHLLLGSRKLRNDLNNIQ